MRVGQFLGGEAERIQVQRDGSPLLRNGPEVGRAATHAQLHPQLVGRARLEDQPGGAAQVIARAGAADSPVFRLLDVHPGIITG